MGDQLNLDPAAWVDLNGERWAYENAPYDTFEPRPEYDQDLTHYRRSGDYR